jgi:tetratricopeptide (TPR) repeat protein
LCLGATGCSQKTPEERLEEAVLMLQQGQLARAVLELRTIVRENPGDPASAQARMYLAQYYVSEGNAARAIEELQAVYDQYGRSEQMGREAGDALMGIWSQVGDLESALKMADEAIAALPPDDEERAGEYKMLRATILVDQDSEESKAKGIEELRTLMLEANSPWQRGQAREILANIHRQKKDYEGSNAVYRDYLEAFPEDQIRSRIELAMAVNVISSGDKEQGRADFDAAAAKLMTEANEELDREQKTQMLQELATFHQSIGDLAGAEQVMLKIMGENPMSMTAIQTQFGIAQMYATAGVLEERDDYFDRGMEILDQIQKENPNTSIAMNAEQMAAQYKEGRENYRKRMEEMKAQEAAATEGGETTEATEVGEDKNE